MFLFEKKQKKGAELFSAKNIELLKNFAMAAGLVAGLKALAYVFNRENA